MNHLCTLPENRPTGLRTGVIMLDCPLGDDQQLTTLYVPDTTPEAGEPSGAHSVRCVLDGNSSVPVGVICALARGTALYLLFDPLHPATNAHLSRAWFDGKLALVTSLGEGPERVLLLDSDARSPGATRRKRWQHSTHDFLQKAINMLHSLPSVFRKDIPELGHVADQRAFWMRPIEELTAQDAAGKRREVTASSVPPSRAGRPRGIGTQRGPQHPAWRPQHDTN